MDEAVATFSIARHTRARRRLTGLAVAVVVLMPVAAAVIALASVVFAADPMAGT
jgi:hypothetical protein